MTARDQQVIISSVAVEWLVCFPSARRMKRSLNDNILQTWFESGSFFHCYVFKEMGESRGELLGALCKKEKNN